ncbi:fluoride efflux transporter CrcB [Methylocella sp.]|uniref:fluoride efflux transporter CrcB n=1 Tax=Methylocella sp. TaxID=1978226 RepID=UPI003783F331
MTFLNCLLVALGGALGSVSRYAVAELAAPWSARMPVGTIVINVAGSFVIGFFGALTTAHGRFPAPEGARIFMMVGFCGGFTTFSSFSLQTFDLLRLGAPWRAFANVALSVVACLAAVAFGYACAGALGGGTRIAQAAIEEEA